MADQLTSGNLSVNEWYGVVGAIVSILTFGLYVRTYWRTVQRDTRKELEDKIDRLDEEKQELARRLREEQEDNRRLERENARLLRRIAKLDLNGSH